MQVTNTSNVPLPLAVWLLTDEYDYSTEENYISVTSLMKPIKQIVLASRVPLDQRTMDVSELVAARMGTALHDSIEKAWKGNPQYALKKLGYPAEVINRLLINPTSQELAAVKDPIAVYLENRTKKKVGKWVVGGKYDLVADGIVQDNKSTSAYSWVYGTRDDDHIRQLSLYRWLNPEIITEDYGHINYIFTDWSTASAKQNPKYPQSRLECKTLALLPTKEVQQWIESRLSAIEKYWDAPESNIPECSDDDLWRSEPKFKYYADPAKTNGRSTKNFDSLADANMFKASKGTGVVITIQGEPKRCNYCAAFDVCKQKDAYFTESSE